MYLRKGSTGSEVESIQLMLGKLGYRPGPADGWFGAKTEAAVSSFQQDYSIYSDGIVGPITQRTLNEAFKDPEEKEDTLLPCRNGGQMKWTMVPADPYRDGYAHLYLRQDVAEAYLHVYQIVKDAGGVLTSSGSRRSLSARVSASRSATSFHYTGRALDLHVGSGMENLDRDPYVVVPEGNRRWRVYVRAEGGVSMRLQPVTYKERTQRPTILGSFLDLTELFSAHGFEGISARSHFMNGGTWLGAEWWHFQYEAGLVKGSSTFGEELLKVYSEEQLAGTPPWRYRNRTFGVDWW